MTTCTILLSLSLLALIVTKAADFITTIRHVGPQAETNPFARTAFRLWGFRGGLVAVGVLWLLEMIWNLATNPGAHNRSRTSRSASQQVAMVGALWGVIQHPEQ